LANLAFIFRFSFSGPIRILDVASPDQRLCGL
jgi:hypothetical protein